MIDRNRIIEPRSLSLPKPERRVYTRTPLSRACKVRFGARTRYMAAVTTDVSAGGVCLQMDDPGAVGIGDTVEFAVSWHGHPTVTHGETIPARVVRVDQGDDRTEVAISFVTPIAIESVI